MFSVLIATVAIHSTATAPKSSGYEADIEKILLLQGYSEYYAKSDAYHGNYLKLYYDLSVNNQLFACIIENESGTRHYNANGGYLRGSAGELGIAQFMKSTFYSFAKTMGFKEAVWTNPSDQLIILDWALKHGLQKYWTTANSCSKIVDSVLKEDKFE